MRSIRSKITLTFVLISAIALIVAGWITDYQIEEYQFDRVVTELNGQVSTVVSILQRYRTEASQTNDAAVLLRDIAARTAIRITLIDDAGNVLFESSLADSALEQLENHAGRPELLDARRTGMGVAQRFSTSVQSPMAYLARPVSGLASNAPFARTRYVRAAMSLAEIQEMQSRIRLIVTASILLTLMLVSGVAVVVSRQISRPIEEMDQLIKGVEQGELARSVPIRTRDEIGRLSATLNQLVARLNQDSIQLQRLETVRSQFLANVSHELRTPLFTLKGFLETLIDGVPDAALQKRFLEKAEAQANRLDQLLTDLIEISRMESGEMKPSVRFFSVNEFIKDVQEEFEETLKRKNQTLDVQLAERDISALGDKELLRSVIRNLLDNATKYSPEGVHVRMGAIEKNETIRFFVQDTGPGIAEEHQARIFERFYRVDTNRSRELGGTGLGLAIVKHIVEAHESAIAVESDGKTGTTFWFELKSRA